MSREAFMVMYRLSWCVTCGLCWWRSHRGWEAGSNTLGLWFWGVFFVVDMLQLGAALPAWADK